MFWKLYSYKLICVGCKLAFTSLIFTQEIGEPVKTRPSLASSTKSRIPLTKKPSVRKLTNKPPKKVKSPKVKQEATAVIRPETLSKKQEVSYKELDEAIAKVGHSPSFYLKPNTLYLCSEKLKKTYRGINSAILPLIQTISKKQSLATNTLGSSKVSPLGYNPVWPTTPQLVPNSPGSFNLPTLIKNTVLTNTLASKAASPKLPLTNNEATEEPVFGQPHRATENLLVPGETLETLPKMMVLSDPQPPTLGIGFSKTTSDLSNGCWYQEVLNLKTMEKQTIWLSPNHGDFIFSFLEFYEILEGGVISDTPVSLGDDSEDLYGISRLDHSGGYTVDHTAPVSVYPESEFYYSPTTTTSTPFVVKPTNPTTISGTPWISNPQTSGKLTFDIKMNVPLPAEYIELDMVIETTKPKK